MEFLNSFGFVGTAVYFDDGRMMVFEGIVDSFKVGVVNNIKYNKSSWGDLHAFVPEEQVISVEEKNRRDGNMFIFTVILTFLLIGGLLLINRSENKNKCSY